MPAFPALRRLLFALTLCSCATVPPPPADPIEDVLGEEDARVMWVGAHPDDESLAGPVLARACIGLGRPCLMAVMNAGSGGECLRREGCEPDLGTVRAGELVNVAHALGAELVHWRYYNAPLPMSSFPSRQELATKWKEQGDPAARIEALIRRFKPTVLLTFDPNHGFTGHPEHQLTSRFATEAVRRASKGPDGHRVEHVYQLLNQYWFFKMIGGGDPGPVTEVFDAHVSCGPKNRMCLDVALAITKAHRSQAADMGRVRALRPQFGVQYLRRIDPFDPELAPDPYE